MPDDHDRKVTHHYTVHYPPHEPRESDPHYRDFDAYRRRTHKTAKCAIGEHRGDYSDCRGPLELHHAHVEFALQNGIDLVWLEQDYPGISDPDSVGAWVESAANLQWLCVLPGSEVLMADGSRRAIEAVEPGEWVITHNGTPGRVEGVSRKRYRGEVACFGGAAFTSSHRIFTSRGWLSAAEILHQVGMHGTDVVFLRGEQNQVARSVVGSVAIEMMDALPRAQRPSNDLFHHMAMFENPSLLSVSPDNHADIPGGIEMPSAAVGSGSLLSVEADDPAGVGAVQVGSRAPMRGSMELATTDGATPHMRWVAPMLTRALYTGWVHDLSVSHNHSFVAGGIAVHNCEFHHRGHGGVHVAAAADFEASRYVRGLIS